jgi:Xaa-Pro aminopeptidase
VYPHQTERLTEALEREGLAALVATTPANVLYVTGFESVLHAAFGTPQFAVFGRSGVALVVPDADVPAVVAESVSADHLVAYRHARLQPPAGAGADEARVAAIAEAAAATPAEALAAALAALGLTSGKIGLDDGGLTPASWQAAVARMANFSVVPAASHLGAARRVKGPWELECLQRALAIAEESLNVVLQTAEPGMTEHAALVAYEGEVVRRGGRPLPGVVVGGARTAIPYPPASERALRPRDLVRFDVGCAFRGYTGRVARTAVVGEPDDRQQRVHDALQAGVEAALTAVKPGVAASAVHGAVVDAVRGAGLPEFACDAVGWGVGLEPSESPAISGDVQTPLVMGEVLEIEVAWFRPGQPGLALGETVLVTRIGSHALNRSVRGLVVLD